MITHFTPSGGRFNFPSNFWKNLLPRLKDGKRYKVQIKEDRSTRSSNQNRYMWGCVYKMISEHTGYELEEVHQLMGKLFLRYTKGLETFVKSTTRLNTKEMEEYLEKVRRFAAMELQLSIPLPNESDYPYE